MKYININCVAPSLKAGACLQFNICSRNRISAFRPHLQEIVKLSHNKIRIFDLSTVSALIRYIAFRGFLVH